MATMENVVFERSYTWFNAINVSIIKLKFKLSQRKTRRKNNNYVFGRQNKIEKGDTISDSKWTNKNEMVNAVNDANQMNVRACGESHAETEIENSSWRRLWGNASIVLFLHYFLTDYVSCDSRLEKIIDKLSTRAITDCAFALCLWT